MQIEIGNKVKIVNPKACYASFRSWVEQHTPEYLENWRESYTPQEIYKENENKNVFVVVAKQEGGSRDRFLIQAYNGYVYLVSDRAIELIDYYL